MRYLWIGLFALGCTGSLAAQSQKPEDLARGKILVTPRDAKDPLFAQMVILIVQYGTTGAVGLVLNRPTDIPISRALRQVPGSAKHSDPVYVGGPVELETVMAVTRSTRQPEGAQEIFGGVFLVAAKTALEKALTQPANPAGMRVYLGYCGWGPHQLENEMRLKAWYIFDQNQSLVFDKEPKTLWTRLVEKTEAEIVRQSPPASPQLVLP